MHLIDSIETHPDLAGYQALFARPIKPVVPRQPDSQSENCLFSVIQVQY